MLPGHLIAEFWVKVHCVLEAEHKLTKKQARHGIEDYRARLDMHRVGDILYHSEAEDIARTIAGAVRQGGFKEPETSTHGKQG